MWRAESQAGRTPARPWRGRRVWEAHRGVRWARGGGRGVPAGPDDAEPANGLEGGEVVVLDHVQRDERAGAAQPCVAVHGQGARDPLGDGHEFGGDGEGRRGAVLEGQLGDCDAGAREGGGVVLGLVEAHHQPHAELLQDVDVVARREVARAAGAVGVVGAVVEIARPAHRDELARDDLRGGDAGGGGRRLVGAG